MVVVMLAILEALNIVEENAGITVKKNVLRANRIGDHIWYISSMKKFKKHYPNWKQKFTTKKILDQLINNIIN